MDSVKGSVIGEREIRMNRKSVKDFQSSENILHDTVVVDSLDICQNLQNVKKIKE